MKTFRTESKYHDDALKRDIKRKVTVAGVTLVGLPLVTMYALFQVYERLLAKKKKAKTPREKSEIEWKIQRLARRAKKLMAKVKKNG